MRYFLNKQEDCIVKVNGFDISKQLLLFMGFSLVEFVINEYIEIDEVKAFDHMISNDNLEFVVTAIPEDYLQEGGIMIF